MIGPITGRSPVKGGRISESGGSAGIAGSCGAGAAATRAIMV
jgi:hypothetical protein